MNLNSSISEPYIVATVSLPTFKLQGITPTTLDVNIIESTSKLINWFITDYEKASKIDAANAYEEKGGGTAFADSKDVS
mgnify:CR=1 FL=1